MSQPADTTSTAPIDPDAPGALTEETTGATSRRLGRLSGSELIPWMIFLVGFGFFPVIFQTPYAHNVGVMVCLTGMMALGWNLLGGFTGQISLGHALFYGIGAYAPAIGAVRLGINPWLAMLGGALLSALFAALIGSAIFRLRGHYFAIATIAVAEIALIAVLNWQWVGAARGMSVPIKPDSFLELQFAGQLKWEYYYIIMAMMLMVLVLTRSILRSRFGHYLIAIREDDTAAASLGVPVARYKMLAFAVSGAIVSVAGTFFTQYVLYVDPANAFGIMISVNIIIAAVIGGVLSMWGPVIGVVVFYAITEFTRIQFGGQGDALNLVIYGLLVMAIAAFEPNGLIGLSARFRRLVTRVGKR